MISKFPKLYNLLGLSVAKFWISDEQTIKIHDFE